MNKFTFREELTLEADNNASKIDISEDIKKIKNKMREYVDSRCYTISLVRCHGDIVIGGDSTNITHLFVPKFVSPLQYRRLFINELSKLGFNEECIEIYDQETNLCEYYNIKLIW